MKWPYVEYMYDIYKIRVQVDVPVMQDVKFLVIEYPRIWHEYT